jgi:hypothetical protein
MPTSHSPNPRACPRCGSNESSGGLTTAVRTCRQCRARFRPPPARWERGLVAGVYLVPSLLGLGVAVVVMVGMIAAPPREGDLALAGCGCSGFLLLGSAVGLFYGFRELAGGQSTRLLADPPPFRPTTFVPPDRARAVVRELAAEAGATNIVAQVDWIEPARIANARARFARDMRSDEVPLVLVDSSFLRNGKAGLLLTNRAVYSSRLPAPVALEDVETFGHRPPDPAVLVWVYLLVPVVACVPPAVLVLLAILWRGDRPLQEALLVNGRVAYVGGKNLARAFWREVLPALKAELTDAAEPDRVGVMETIHQGAEGAVTATPQVRDPTWAEIEAAVRALDGWAKAAVRLWAGEPGSSAGLEVRGGEGKYALRDLTGDWVYYDPAGGDEEVDVCVGDLRHRCPGYAVSADVDRVLEIARGFAATGTLE